MENSNIKVLRTNNEPDAFSLPKAEFYELKCLKLENVFLNKELELLEFKEKIWMMEVSNKLKLDVSKYTVDMNNGNCIKKQEIMQQETNNTIVKDGIG